MSTRAIVLHVRLCTNWGVVPTVAQQIYQRSRKISRFYVWTLIHARTGIWVDPPMFWNYFLKLIQTTYWEWKETVLCLHLFPIYNRFTMHTRDSRVIRYNARLIFNNFNDLQISQLLKPSSKKHDINISVLTHYTPFSELDPRSHAIYLGTLSAK